MDKDDYLLLRDDGTLEFAGTYRECVYLIENYVPEEERALYTIVRSEEE